MEDKRSATFFKITNAIAKLRGPSLVRDALISTNDLEDEVSKLKDKWDKEFCSLSDLFEERNKAWTIYYVNVNNNISIIVNED